MSPALLAPAEADSPLLNSVSVSPLECAADCDDMCNGVQAAHPELLSGLQTCPKHIPCSYLYDGRGSDLYDQIVTLPEYYPYNAELEMLKCKMPSILKQIPPGCVVVELGCGSATKTGIIIRALLDRDGPDACFYEGIDCSSEFLQSARENLQEACPGLLAGNLGTICALYLEGLQEARRRHPDQVLCVLWLGSSVGNLDDAGALAFFKDVLRIGGPGTQVFLCVDLWKDAAVLHAAYCDSKGVTEKFIQNGLSHALGALGVPVAHFARDWTYDVVINAELQQVEMWLVAPTLVSIPGTGIVIAAGERVLMEVSRKFTPTRLRALAFQSGWCWQAGWASPKYSMQMLLTPHLALRSCWADTDAQFATMPDWASHPITIRHPFCFYYGHMAAFAKIKMLPEDEMTTWDTMFSRGIDPDVLDPSKCHSHPDAPPQWPTKSEIVAYATKARAQLLAALQDGRAGMQGVYLALEHERMHQETLAYMQAQQRRTAFEASLKGPIANGHAHGSTPAAHTNGHANGHHAASGRGMSNGDALGASAFKTCPAGRAVVGVGTAGQASGFVWDNEGPQQEPVAVEAFAAAAFPVTVHDFKKFALEQRGYDRAELWDPTDFKHMRQSGLRHPATWTVVGGDVWVHTQYATRHWTEVADQPVWVSLAEAEAFCAAHGARIMTEPEYLRLLAEDGAASSGGQRWHMLRSGGWEWTSTAFTALHGFQPMQEYPEYSADFFDGKHMVLKGSAPVTHPSVIRDSFRNFYQRQYPFMFAKFRCCKSGQA